MLSVQSLASLFLILLLLRTISASPVPQHYQQAKRGASPQNVGSGFAIAICIIILAGVFYYLGMHHERTKLWFNKGKASVSPETARGSETITEGPRHKRQISCPLAVSSSAPIKPYDDPVEAPTASLRYYELPIKEVHELGLPSPKKPPTTASWLSLDRKPWWLTYPDKEGRRQSARTSVSRGMRTWFRSDSVSSISEDPPTPPPLMPGAVLTETRHEAKDDGERKSEGSTLIDWSGLDYMRRIYVQRKSKIGL
ncbi:hypothetical protein SVAN01_02299 [Stagonosporopsis vannaccii]|nr:hypothetical protein SVAN01_02299 [Stagonosporopsis vannaccii]